MMRSIPALAALALFAATAPAAPVALKDLTTPVLQAHFTSYLVVDEAKVGLARIAPFATLDPGGLRITENVLVWEYSAAIPLTPQQETLVREVAVALVTKGLAFNGGLLSDADAKTLIATLRVSPKPVPQWWTSYIGYRYGPAYLSTYRGHGCLGGKGIYRGGPWPSQLLITAPYPAAAYALPYPYYPIPAAVPYTYYPAPYTAPYTFPVVPYVLPGPLPVAYQLVPETAKRFASANTDTLLGEVQYAYRGRNYAAALELAALALEKDPRNPLLWCWRSAAETQLGRADAAGESALRAKACQMIVGIESDKIANAIEIIQGKPRSVLSAASTPKDDRTALAIASKPLPLVARTQDFVSK